MLVGLPSISRADETIKRLTPFGESFALGFGSTTFLADATSEATDTGCYWEARAAFGTRSYLGGEAAYRGASNGVRALGLDSTAFLLQNGVEGALRVNLPIERGVYLSEPFVLGGIGWSHYDVHGQTATFALSSMKDSSDVLTVPVGAGFAFARKHLILDARFTYRPAFNDDLMTAANSSAGLQNWTAGTTVGFEY